MLRVPVEPGLIRWARVRSRRDDSEFTARFPHLAAWEQGTARPTWRQLNQFADFTYTPVGYLLLGSPPPEPLPIPDLRTIADRGVSDPSPDLLDTIYLCEQRQAWYADFATTRGLPPSTLAGSTRASGLPRPVEVASVTRTTGFSVEARRTMAGKRRRDMRPDRRRRSVGRSAAS